MTLSWLIGHIYKKKRSSLLQRGFKFQDIQEVVKSQAHNTLLEFEKRAREVVGAMQEQGLNAALYYENPG